MLTAMEKAEIEHAICSGHLGSRLTEAEARYFAAIIRSGRSGDDVSDNGGDSADARATAGGGGVVEGEAAAMVCSQRTSSGSDDGVLAAGLLRSHDHAVTTATWSGTGSGGIVSTGAILTTILTTTGV